MVEQPGLPRLSRQTFALVEQRQWRHPKPRQHPSDQVGLVLVRLESLPTSKLSADPARLEEEEQVHRCRQLPFDQWITLLRVLEAEEPQQGPIVAVVVEGEPSPECWALAGASWADEPSQVDSEARLVLEARGYWQKAIRPKRLDELLEEAVARLPQRLACQTAWFVAPPLAIAPSSPDPSNPGYGWVFVVQRTAAERSSEDPKRPIVADHRPAKPLLFPPLAHA